MIDIVVRPILRTNSAEVIVGTLVGGFAAGPVQKLLVRDELAAGSWSASSPISRSSRRKPSWCIHPFALCGPW